MKKSRYREDQIVGILKEHEAGVPLPELTRKYGFSDQSFYRWKAKYGGLDVSDVRRLKGLEDENRRLKQIVADLSLDNQALKGVLAKNF